MDDYNNIDIDDDGAAINIINNNNNDDDDHEEMLHQGHFNDGDDVNVDDVVAVGVKQLQEHGPKSCISQEVMNIQYEMKNNNNLCDAIIHCDDGAAFNVHRIILCACSDFFRAMFTTTLEKNEKHDIKIPGIKSVTMQKIIDYAYTRKCSIDNGNVFEIYTVADYVGMIGLIKVCTNYMCTMITPENCIGLLVFGRARFCKQLENISKSYVLRNFIKIIECSEEIWNLDFDLFYEIINDDMLNTKDEEPVWNCCLKWIDKDEKNRMKYLTKLMRGVRLGLLNTKYFNENVKEHPYVKACDDAKPLIIETLTFLYDLDMMSTRNEEISTPALALPRLPHEVIFAIGGWSDGLPQRYIESYDTRADRWIRVLQEDSAGPRAYHGTAVIGFKIYCIGGFDGIDYFNTCRVFDAEHKLWNEIAPMHCRRCYVSVTELNGLIYALGGYDGQNRQNTTERYNPQTNQWTMMAPMNIQRSDADACSLNGKIYITGGFNGLECLNSAEYYEPDENRWTLITNMLSRRSGVSCVAHKGSIYVIGGFNGLTRMNTGERYDPDTEQWTFIREMYHPRSNFGIEIIDDMIFAIGGFNGMATIAHAECYVVEDNEWLEATDMSIIRSALSANVVAGLPNIRDYIHKDRERLMEERRLRMYTNQQDDVENLNDVDDDVVNNANDDNDDDDDSDDGDGDDGDGDDDDLGINENEIGDMQVSDEE